MTNYKEIFRLYCSGDYSQREISQILGVSRNTVSRCIDLAEKRRIGLPVSESLSNEDLAKLLFPGDERKQIRRLHAMPDFEHLSDELKKPHMTKKLLWKEYVMQCKDSDLAPYSISQFNALFSDYLEKHNISLSRHRNPGEVLELDWSGSAITLHGKAPGLERKCHLFVAAFPFSGYFFAEAFADERIHSWIRGITDSFVFFGGVPVILRPDNTRTAIIKPDRYEPELNTVMLELSEYYQTVTIPARVRKPRDKNVVENSVSLASTYIIAALRNQVFYSLDGINEAVMERVCELNDEPFTKKEGSRRILFEHEEKPCLLPLPARQFQLFERARAKVAPDYHVQFDKCFYSVHPKYIGEEMRIKADSDTVIILAPSGEEAARHQRGCFKGQKITDPSHIPQAHQEILGWSGDYFRREAERIGPNTGMLIDRVLASRRYEVQAYKACRGILNLRRKVGAQRLEDAAREALLSGAISYKSIKAIAETLGDAESDEEAGHPDDESSLFLTHSPSDSKEDCNDE